MSGRYKAYGEYKDSGVEWLGEIPREWSVLMGKRIFSSIRKTALKDDVQLAVSQKYGVLPQSLMMLLNDSKVMLALKGTDSFRHVDQNDFVISLRSFEGGIEYSKYSGCVSPAYTVLNNVKKISHNYYKYLLKCAPFISALQSTTDSLRDGKSISYEQFGAICLPLTRLSEQTQIAAFLDHETAKIDTLIDKQQQLIELLKEKRQAVISHAVTKGLDPDVPMKDSGVDWLGEVPEHWKVLAIKKIVSTPITDGPHETPNFIEEGVSFISAEAISSGVIDFSKQRACISIKDHIRFSEKYKPHLYDIYIVKSGATTGVSAIVETINDFNIWSPLAAIRCSEIAFPYFVLYFLRSQQFLTAIELNWSFGTQQNIGMGVIGNIYISCPPIKEAIIISDHIRQKCSKIEKLITLATHQISLMQERRTALISAAVTGKIDVRDRQVPVTQTESDEVMA
ncbi:MULTISPECIES: restriction endonuclease subunit S [Rahnella]|uniref:restriction endonuclease subunit S n=1 Tax=Rahnella TaxID=34037 RepID=UPI003D28B0CA